MGPRRMALIGVAFLAVFAAVLFGGYVLGSASVSDHHDALVAKHEARASAFAAARRSSRRRSYRLGIQSGVLTARRAALRAGAQRGDADGAADADVRLTARQASQAKQSQANLNNVGNVGNPGDLGIPSVGHVDLGAGGVLVVGDSLEVLTSPYLKSHLPGAHITVNAVGGYNSFQIFDLFKESYDPSQTVIVYDSGTNDNPNYPEILAGRLKAAASIIGPNRCMVVPTIHGFTVNGVNNAGKNRVVHSFAASRPGTQTPDWARTVATHPELMQSDDLHPIPAGADYRAKQIAAGVKACFAYNAGGL